MAERHAEGLATDAELALAHDAARRLTLGGYTEDAEGVIERVVVDHKARMAGAGVDLEQFAERYVLLHRDDVGARHHHVHGLALAQAKDVAEHGAFLGREAGLAGAGCQYVPEVGADGACLPAEQRAQRARQPAIAVRARHRARQRNRNREIAGLARGARPVGRRRIAGGGMVRIGHGSISVSPWRRAQRRGLGYRAA